MPTAEVSDPILNPDFQNEAIEIFIEHFKDRLRDLFQNYYPKGYAVGEQLIKDKAERLRAFMAESQKNAMVAAAPSDQVNPGDQDRARNSLFEEQKLRLELFGER